MLSTIVAEGMVKMLEKRAGRWSVRYAHKGSMDTHVYNPIPNDIHLTTTKEPRGFPLEVAKEIHLALLPPLPLRVARCAVVRRLQELITNV